MNQSLLQNRLVRCLLMSVALALGGHASAVAAPKPSRYPIVDASYNAFWWGDFALLEKWNASYRQPGSIDPDGAHRLDLLRSGIAKVFNASVKDPEAYMNELDAVTLKWAQDNPRSAFAHILHARSLVAHAQSYRGSSWASDVPPEAWEFHRRYLEKALAYLRDHADIALTDSYAHLVLLTIGRHLSWDKAQMAAIAEDGIKRNPEDIDLYFAVLDSLLPKWGGDAKALDRYIKQVTENTRAQYGMGMYPRLYGQAADDQYGAALFEASHADWDKMKQGYEDLLIKYPANLLRRNRYAYMACIAKDKATFLRVLGEIGTQVQLDGWGSNPERALETCRKWATQL